jgi:hypothetical protein
MRDRRRQMDGSRELSRVTAEDVLTILQSYRCRYQQYSGECDGMQLMDVLAPAEDRTIERGEEEIRRLADHIAAELSKQLVSKSTETEVVVTRCNPERL